MIICFVTNTIFSIQECIQINDMGIKIYIKDSVNKMDILFHLSFNAYFGIRLSSLSQIIVSQYAQDNFCLGYSNSTENTSCNEDDPSTQIMISSDVFSREFLSIFTCLIMVGAFLKFCMFLRIFEKAGQIIRLCYNVLFFSSYFSVFFFAWILVFSFIYLILGNTFGGHADTGHDGDDYERLTYFAGLFLYSYRTAIGDLETPNALIWTLI